MTTLTPDQLMTSSLLALAAVLVHAAFQVGISVMTLLSGHSLGAKRAHGRLLHLNGSYITGVIVTLIALLITVLFVIHSFESINQLVLWIVATFIAFVSGLSVILGYYRRGRGTLLWLPRNIAEYLSERAKATNNGVEAAALGAMTVVAELPFIISVVLIFALVIMPFTFSEQLLAIAIYALLVSLPLIITTIMLGAGERLSTIQRWREDNKSFLQYSSGIGLLLVALYIMTFQIASAA